MAEVRFENVVKSFGAVKVIDTLNLTVRDGEFFTFVGPSGCGKSTILNLVAGLESPTAGTIHFDAQPVNHVAPRDRDVAMVFQSYALYPHMTVFDNIAFPLKMRKVPRDRIATEVEQTAALLEIEGFLRRRPRELSGGQRQRVALARAIIRRPKVFLMDEPLSNLDAKLRVETRAELKRLHQRLKTTTIYVTHDQEEAMGLSERIAVLADGKVRQCGTPEEVFAKPTNIFVAGFLGSPPMNFLPGRVENGDPFEVAIGDVRLRPQVERRPSSPEVMLGVRPEDIRLSPSAGRFQATVLTTEFVGSGSWIELEWMNQRLKGFQSGDCPLEPGSSVFFDLVADRCHLFDRATGERL
jgi:multiple sugar transport system ATP-binding protein